MHCCSNSDTPSMAVHPPKSLAQKGIGTKWPYLCLAGVGAGFVALTVFKISPANLLFYGAILACPLLHVFMMKDHAGGTSHHKTPEK